jgi:lysophospholipase L1-like esterase
MHEPAVSEYIAYEGEAGKWDLATLEIGINVLKWDEEKIISRTENLIRQVAGRNPNKPIFVISPFYNCGDDFNEEKRAGGERWRRLVGEITVKLNYPNVTYINGLDVIGDMSYISADEVHPNIYGVQRIADVLTEKIREVITQRNIS